MTFEQDARGRSLDLPHGPGKEARPGPGKQTLTGGLPGELRAGVEQLSGLDMSDVTVHRDSARPATLGAYASAEGSQIHLGKGQDHHLAHEAWHVVQQQQGRVAATAQLKGIAVNDDDALEREADVMGDRAAALGAAGGGVGAAPRQLAASGSVAQLAAPGAITHVTNSCFAAALINIFTVTPALNNLANPTANHVVLGGPAIELRNLLWRAVNTVDAGSGAARRVGAQHHVVAGEQWRDPIDPARDRSRPGIGQPPSRNEPRSGHPKRTPVGRPRSGHRDRDKLAALLAAAGG